MGPLDSGAPLLDAYGPPRFSWNLPKPWKSLSFSKQQ